MAKLGGMIHQTEPPEKSEDIRKDRTTLEMLGLIVRSDGI